MSYHYDWKDTQTSKSLPVSDYDVVLWKNFFEKEMSASYSSGWDPSYRLRFSCDKLSSCVELLDDLMGVGKEQLKLPELSTKEEKANYMQFPNSWFRTVSEMRQKVQQCIRFCRAAHKRCNDEQLTTRADKFYNYSLRLNDMLSFIRTPPTSRMMAETETEKEAMEVDQHADCTSASIQPEIVSEVVRLKAEIDSLKVEKKNLQHQDNKLQERLDCEHRKRLNLQENLDSMENLLKAEIDSLKVEKKNLQHQNNELQERLDCEHRKRLNLQENLDSMENFYQGMTQENTEYSKKYQQLQETVSTLKHKNGTLNTRLSKLMETQERERIDAHEDLCDHYRPSKIVLMFKELYKKKYLDISEALDKQKWAEDTICNFLLDAIQVAYEHTNHNLDKFREQISESVTFSIKKQFKVDSKRNLPAKMSDAINEMIREQVDSSTFVDSITTKVYQKMKEKCHIAKEPSLRKMLKTYISECVKVTFLMNACTPPMWIDCSDKIYDPKKHTKYDGKGDQIRYFAWPCVYFSKKSFEADKPVMEKGEVVVCDHVRQDICSSGVSAGRQLTRRVIRRDSREGSRSGCGQKESNCDDYDVIHDRMLEDTMSNRQIKERMDSEQPATIIYVNPISDIKKPGQAVRVVKHI